VAELVARLEAADRIETRKARLALRVASASMDGKAAKQLDEQLAK